MDRITLAKGPSDGYRWGLMTVVTKTDGVCLWAMMVPVEMSESFYQHLDLLSRQSVDRGGVPHTHRMSIALCAQKDHDTAALDWDQLCQAWGPLSDLDRARLNTHIIGELRAWTDGTEPDGWKPVLVKPPPLPKGPGGTGEAAEPKPISRWPADGRMAEWLERIRRIREAAKAG